MLQLLKFEYIFNDATNSTYTVRVRQYTATYHSHDFPEDIDIILDSSSNMNLYVTNKPDMTVSRAQTETNNLTGLRDFNSKIFVYSGHGVSGYACYDKSMGFASNYLPNMSNCELAIWDCCKSAKKDFFGNSMVDDSIGQGAKTVIGWDVNIYSVHSTNYINYLFIGLENGMSIADASNFALSSYDFNSSSNALTILEGLIIKGDKANVIFPKTTYKDEIITMTTTSNNLQVNEDSILRDGYFYVGSYQDGTVDFYAKLINGVITDDFVIVYKFSNGSQSIVESKCKLSDLEIMTAQEKYGSIVIDEMQKKNYFYIYKNDELVLVKRVVNYESELSGSYVFIDPLTNLEIQIENGEIL